MASAIPVHVNISEIWEILGISNSFLSFPPTAFRAWTEEREKWATKQKILARTRDFFSELYKISIAQS